MRALIVVMLLMIIVNVGCAPDIQPPLDTCVIVTNGMAHGSGVAIAPDLILTAGHCADIAGLYVIGPDGTEYAVIDAWRSDIYDVGFLRIDGDLPYAAFGDAPQLLDKVYLVGAPYSMEFCATVTEGIISYMGRDIWDRAELIQTDAEGAHGSSGGPLFNERWEIIGICVAGPIDGGGITLCEPIEHIRQAFEEYENALTFR